MVRFISNFIAIWWFFLALIWAIVLGIVMTLGLLFFEIIPMMKSGAAMGTPTGFAMLAFIAFAFALTGWIPSFRKCYYKLPWLYPLVVMIMMNALIIAIAEWILYEGLSTMDTTHHVVTVIIVLAELILGRWLMCKYLAKNPKVIHKYDRIQ